MRWFAFAILQALKYFFGIGELKWLFYILVGGVVAFFLFFIICLLCEDSDPQLADTGADTDNANNANSDNTYSQSDAPRYGNRNTCQTPDVIYL